MPKRTLILVLAAVGVLAPAAAASAATIPVTTTADVTANDGLCSLREAVSASALDVPVNGCPGGAGADLIQLKAGVYDLTAAGGVVEDGNASGDLDLSSGVLQIAGAGMGATAIDAHGGDRIITVFKQASLSLSDLTLRNGNAGPGGNGGAVMSFGPLTLSRVAATGNVAGDGKDFPDAGDAPSGDAGGSGGAVWIGGESAPDLQIADAVFADNRAGNGGDGGENDSGAGKGGNAGSGGAVFVGSGLATITGATFARNSVGDGGLGGSTTPRQFGFNPWVGGDGGAGGAVAVDGGTVTITNATFQGNHAGRAGDALSRSTFSARQGGGGAAAQLAGTLRVNWSTFQGDTTASGPGGAPLEGTALMGGQVSASILAESGVTCVATTPGVAANVTLPGDTSCPGTRIAGDARLAPLADNGGPVPTMALGAGSAAIDALVGVPCPGTDARGLLRPRFAGCDAGAFEVQPGQPGAPGGGGGGTTAGRRTIAKLTLGPSAFRTRGRKAGTTVRFTLDAAGRVVLTVTKPAAGRRSKGRCLAPTRRLAGARRCTRQVKVPGRLALAGKLGPNAVRFFGTLRGKALKPGAYTLVLTLPPQRRVAGCLGPRGLPDPRLTRIRPGANIRGRSREPPVSPSAPRRDEP